MTKEEYRDSILERARLRRELFEQQQALETQGPSETAEEAEAATELEETTAVEETELCEASESGSDIEEEEDVLTERDLFLQLVDYNDVLPTDRPRRYVPFEPSEDDDEYQPKPEESFVLKWFKKLEDENAISARESQAVYEEEEVSVKLVHFDEDREKEPVRLVLSPLPKKELQRSLSLRRLERVESTKTKLFQRTRTQRIVVLSIYNSALSAGTRVVLESLEVGTGMDQRLLESLQRVFDVSMASGKARYAQKLFLEIERDPQRAFSHLQSLFEWLPHSIDLVAIAQCVPSVLLPSSREALDIGAECAGVLYPCLYLFEKTFRLGLCNVELLKDVLRLGNALLAVRSHLSESLSVEDFRTKLENANAVVPNFAKVVESTSVLVTPEAIGAVVREPVLTRNRIAACKKRVYNWPDFNLYAYPDFTLSSDATKFERFCEMYNATRRLQKDFAEHPSDPQQGGIHDALYFWKQNWMRGEESSGRRPPNGVLPHQFTSIYAAFEVVEQEGLAWSSFLKGLSVLSEQREVGVYEELYFYAKLRASRSRASASMVLRDGVVEVIRMMARRRQISFDQEPSATEAPLFDVAPLHRETEIFA